MGHTVGACDQSAGDAYSSKAHDPTSGFVRSSVLAHLFLTCISRLTTLSYLGLFVCHNLQYGLYNDKTEYKINTRYWGTSGMQHLQLGFQSPLTTHKGVYRIYSNPNPHGCRLSVYCYTSRSRIFRLHGDVTIAGEGLQNLGLYARRSELGGILKQYCLFQTGKNWNL
jgi:hypothetical protein